MLDCIEPQKVRTFLYSRRLTKEQATETVNDLEDVMRIYPRVRVLHSQAPSSEQVNGPISWQQVVQERLQVRETRKAC